MTDELRSRNEETNGDRIETERACLPFSQHKLFSDLRLFIFLPSFFSLYPVLVSIPLFASNRYAFVEYEDQRDSEDAYHDMHGKRMYDGTLSIQVSFRVIIIFRII